MRTPRSRSSRLPVFLALLTLLASLFALAPAASAAAPPTLSHNCVQQGKAVSSAACTKLFKTECGTSVKKYASDCNAYLAAKGKGTAGTDNCPDTAIISWGCHWAKGVANDFKKGYDAGQHPVQTFAASAFNDAAKEFGQAAESVLQQITSIFLHMSSIDLADGGVMKTYETLWALSGIVAALLLLLQFAKVAVTASGQAAATALIGLVKWAFICLGGLAVTQFALYASDDISQWLISQFYANDADFQKRLGLAFGDFLASSVTNPALILVCAVVAIVVLVALWGEMLMRAAAIEVLVVCMPIAAAGSMMDGTKEWFPKARNAIISLIVIKPVIVLIFVMGFGEFAGASDLNGFLVGLLTLVLGVIAWPAVAKFMTFTTAGGGTSFLSGLLGAAGGTAASLFAAGGGFPSGVGALGGGNAFTKGVESQNDAAASGSGAAGGDAGGGRHGSGTAGGGRAGGGFLGSLGGIATAAMAAQVTKAGKEHVEGGMEAMAAHADLGSGKDMGGQVSLPPGGGHGAGSEPPPQAPPPDPGPPTVTLDRPPAGDAAAPPAITPDGSRAPVPANGAAQLTPVPPPKPRAAIPPPPPPATGSDTDGSNS